MKTLTRPNTPLATAGGAAAIAVFAVAAFGMTSAAHARDNVTFSVGIGVPGVVIGASNGYPVYSQPQPVYVQPQPVYIQPRPVYVQPAPVYFQGYQSYQGVPSYYGAPQVYAVPQPIYFDRPHKWRHGHRERDDEHHGERQDYYRPGYAPGRGYAPVYYQR